MLSRLKFDLNELAEIVLNTLPDSVFESESTTFFDPAMGGGQFIIPIEKRLREQGCTEKQISKRVFGYADHQLAVEFVKNRYKSSATINKGSLSEDDIDMKFDVGLTNPPYQSTNEGERNIGAPLWPKFIEETMTKIKPDGYCVFVTPATWMNRAKRGAWKTISKYDLVYVNTSVDEYFPNISIPNGICYFVLRNRPYGGVTSVNGDLDMNFHEDELPKNTKILNKDTLKEFHALMPRRKTLDVRYGPIDPSINSNAWSPKETKKHKFETYYSGREDRRSIWCSQEIGDYGKWKLVIPSNGDISKKVEITKKGVGRQGSYILGTKKELLKIKDTMLSDESRRLSDLNMEGQFNDALNFIVE